MRREGRDEGTYRGIRMVLMRAWESSMCFSTVHCLLERKKSLSQWTDLLITWDQQTDRTDEVIRSEITGSKLLTCLDIRWYSI
jgi:hypothetical protein